MSVKDTIAAIATPHGVGGIGVIRVSGQKAKAIAETISKKTIVTQKIQFSSFYDQSNDVLDHGIILYFKAPNSFTGEDVVEFQGHGGVVIQDMMMQEINSLGVRTAKPGEFSERAFLNNKIDLTQAEAIADLIESGSQAAAKAAMRSLQGAFSKKVHEITDKIINLRCYIEAALDFSEEEIDFLAEGKINEQLETIEHLLIKIIKDAENGQRLNDGLTLAIAGLPNAGKSSLLNYLTGHDTAIVTPIAGTTRDIISEQISLNGIPIRLSDTAGLRETDDIVEQEGIKKAWKVIQQADVVLLLVDSTAGLTDYDKDIVKRLGKQKYAIVYTKLDLVSNKHKLNVDEFQISTIN
ncbi:MAG: tRNA uridine-5-carboxymethylaminomethyl(34) synthesis GTPase MnmE, partial [Gammaproteobacteria bacterium]|nr:tRNA uridine-5-carboxymethylaminomethyl(34) synthesis GTPase MnmE [Gammaproteobacteria bacterium]